MKKQILINIETGERRIAILSDNKLDDYTIERIEKEQVVGNIYKGIVSSVVPAIGAAFINYGPEKNGFLYVTDAFEALQDCDEDEIFTENSEKRKTNLRIEDILKQK